MSHKWVLQCFKEAFPPKMETELLQIDDMDITISKALVKIMFPKPKLPDNTNPSMIAHIMERSNDTVYTQANNIEPSIFQKAFCKMGIYLEGLTRVKL